MVDLLWSNDYEGQSLELGEYKPPGLGYPSTRVPSTRGMSKFFDKIFDNELSQTEKLFYEGKSRWDVVCA